MGYTVTGIDNSKVGIDQMIDKANDTYWLGAPNSEHPKQMDLVNININDASVNKIISLEKPIKKLH